VLPNHNLDDPIVIQDMEFPSLNLNQTIGKAEGFLRVANLVSFYAVLLPGLLDTFQSKQFDVTEKILQFS